MRRFPRLSGRLVALLAAGGVALVLPLLPVAASAAGGNGTCSGGSVAAGTYQSLTVTGFCSVDSGAVTVTNAGADGHVIIDAVQWIPAKE